MLLCSTVDTNSSCARGGPGDESQGYNSTNLISLFQAAPSPSALAQTDPARCQQTQGAPAPSPCPAEAITGPWAGHSPSEGCPWLGALPCHPLPVPRLPQQSSAGRAAATSPPHSCPIGAPQPAAALPSATPALATTGNSTAASPAGTSWQQQNLLPFSSPELLCAKICQADALNDQGGSATFGDPTLFQK